MGHIPDGVYNFIGNCIELLSGPSRTVSELERLAGILRNIKKQETSIKQATQRISEEAPELNSLAQLFPKTRSELYAFVSIILTVIAIIISQLKSFPAQNIEINQVINNIYQQQIIPETRPIPKVVPKQKIPLQKVKKTGRNETCPCGSGIKYKKCCIDKKAANKQINRTENTSVLI